MDCAVEVLAIYEDPGVNPNAARINQRDSDRDDATAQSNQRTHAAGATPYEYLRNTEPKYGFGWQCKLWLSVRADAQQVGNAVWTRLSGRSLRPGSKVEVFDGEGAQPGQTGALLYRRSPSQTAGPDIG
jgi:hypothetical protein